MIRRQDGQAFILILILLAIGALLIVPTLRLSSAALSNSRIVTRQVKSLYAADAAQEWILWKLTWDGLGSEFTEDGQTASWVGENAINICDIPVDITIVMRALEGEGGMTLATDDVIRPTKTVYPDTINNDATETITYTIRLEQLSDNNTQGLDAIYDILPKTFAELDYQAGSSKLSVDGGPWESIPDPSKTVTGGQVRLLWPATYVWDDDTQTGTGGFTSPIIRDFEVREVKELKFEITHTFSGLDKDSTLSNWVVLKPWDTLSGPQASITVGDGSTQVGRLLGVSKVSVPEIIQPGVETDIEYTISITNLDTETRMLDEIIDYLPSGFTYIGPTSGDIANSDPQMSLENLNGVDRWELMWTTAEFLGAGAKSVASGETVYLTFWARATKDMSGSYYNEVIVIPDVHAPTIFSQIGVSDEEYYAIYSWNTGTILVPFYDGRTDADGVIIDSNIGLMLGGIAINSWQIR